MNKHQPESGHDIEKLLTEVIPQADTHFQEKLEGHLLAAYLQKKERNKVKANGHLVTYTDFVPQRSVGNRNRRWSITLVATLLMALLVGFILISIGDNRPVGYSGASLLTTPTITYASSGTPETEIFQPVVVATMHIPQGIILSSDMLEVQQWKLSYIPPNSFTRVEDLIGAMSRTDISSKSPIIEAQVILPNDLAIIDFPLEENGLRPVVVTTRDLMRGTILSSEMLDIVSWPADGLPTGSFPISTLLIGQRLVTDLRANSPILFKHLALDSEGTEIEAGRVAIVVPMPDDPFFYGFQVGDTLSITASFFYVDADEININQITPIPDLPESIVVPTDAVGNGRLSVQEVIPDAKIVSLNTMDVADNSDVPIMILAVTPDQAETLTWLLDTQIPLQYRIVALDWVNQENPPNSESQGDLPDESTSLGISPDVSTELKPIIITTQAIPRGTIITEEMLTIGYTASGLASLVPFDNIEEYVGKMTVTNLPAYSLILDDQVVGYGEGQTPPIGEEFITILVGDEINNNYQFGFTPGDHIDIVASLLTVPSDDSIATLCQGLFSLDGTPMPCHDMDDVESPQKVTERVIEDAEVVSVDLVTSQSGNIITITMQMSPAAREMMNWLLDAKVPLAYVLR